jgi:transcriptional regulator with XRE-family HTH domain
MFATLTYCAAGVDWAQQRIDTMIDADRFYEDLGRAIRARREALEITQAELGVGIGLSRTSVTNIECGRQRLLIDQFCRLAEVLRCERDDLLSTVSANAKPKDSSALPASVASFVERTMRTRAGRKP